jgi:hypothetical protein
MKVWNGTELTNYQTKDDLRQEDKNDQPCYANVSGLDFGVKVLDGLSWITVNPTDGVGAFCGNVSIKVTCPLEIQQENGVLK